MDPLRPVPRPTVLERARALLDWVRLPRLVAMAVSVLIVAGGSWWLLRSPSPPVEQTLPFASSSGSSSKTTPTTAGKRSATATGSSTLPPGQPAASASSSSSADASASTAAAPPMIVVQAAGAVASPGVFSLPRGARVNDLVAAAGGLRADADGQSVNLAAVLADGQRVYLPRVGESSTTAPSTTSPAVAPDAAGTSGTAGSTMPIDINHADAAAIDRLPGIGPSTATAIVAYREANGPYSSPDDLLKVRGIGPAKLAAIRSMVTT